MQRFGWIYLPIFVDTQYKLKEIKRFFIAMGYFSRLPIPRWVGYSTEELQYASRYFPLVGSLLGAWVALILWLASEALPASLAVLLSMVFSFFLTGAFHEDGLADSADGFGGGWEKSDVLRIMKDSRLGTYGALTLFTAILIKFFALQNLLLQANSLALISLVCAHATSRMAALWVMGALHYVREDESSRSKAMTQGSKVRELLIGTLCGLAPVLLFAGLGLLSWYRLCAILVVCMLTAGLCGRYFLHRLGGYTGDCLGAVQQITELGIYLVFCLHLTL